MMRGELFSRGLRYVPLALWIAWWFGLAFALDNYLLYLCTIGFCYAISLFAINLITGYNAQFSLAGSAFIAFGAYVTLLMVNRAGFSVYSTLLPSFVLSYCVGWLFCIPVLRLPPLYLALVTLMLSSIVPDILVYFRDYTSGLDGVRLAYSVQAPSALWFLTRPQWLYFFCLACVVLVYHAMNRLVHSRHGRAIMALRDNELAATIQGVPSAYYRQWVFATGSALLGVSGSLILICSNFVGPDTFTPVLSINLLLASVVGGLGYLHGPFYGAVFLQLISVVSDALFHGHPDLPFALIIIAIAMLFQNGVAGSIATLRHRFASLSPKVIA